MVFVSTASYVALGVQVTILAIMLYGVCMMMVMRRRRAHVIMATLVVLNVITLAEVMVPTYYSLRPSPVNLPASIMLVHRYMGLTAVVLTTIVAFTWILRGREEQWMPGDRAEGAFHHAHHLRSMAAAQLQGIAVLAAYI